jgi:hypothetical protein
MMTENEYQFEKSKAHEIIKLARDFDAWRFKHEAKLRGERDLGQWMWAIHLEAKVTPL